MINKPELRRVPVDVYFIGQSALECALNHVRFEKEAAIDGDDIDTLSAWRDTEKSIIAALGGLGLPKIV